MLLKLIYEFLVKHENSKGKMIGLMGLFYK